MKAYGFTRYDKLACPYGCCTTDGGKKLHCREAVARNRRKKARAEGKKFVCDEVTSGL